MRICSVLLGSGICYTALVAAFVPPIHSLVNAKSQNKAIQRRTLDLHPSTIMLRAEQREGSDSKKASLTSSNAIEEVAPYSWFVLGALGLVYVSNQWSRNLLPYMVNFGESVSNSPDSAKEYMNVALSFDQTQYSVLASFGFTLLYSIASLFAGNAVDKFSRKGTTVAACLAWSLVTVGQGAAGSFQQVLGLRVCQGIAQAFTTPAAYTLLADAFPPTRRATASSIYSSAVYFGGALASLTVLLNTNFGWRDSSFVVGGLGITAALAAQLILKEPKRGAGDMNTSIGSKDAKSEPVVAIPLQESVKMVLSNKTVQLLFAASAVRFMAGFSIGIWAAPYFRAQFPDSAAEYAVINAFVVGVGGVTSSLLGGFLTDKFAPSDIRYKAWVPMAGCLLAVPTWAAVVSAGDFRIAMACLFAEYIVAECWFGPAVSILQGALPPTVRGTGQGVFSMLTAVGNIAPVIIGSLSASYPLQDVLLYFVPILYAISALLFYITGEMIASEAKTAAKDI